MYFITGVDPVTMAFGSLSKPGYANARRGGGALSHGQQPRWGFNPFSVLTQVFTFLLGQTGLDMDEPILVIT